MNGCLDMNIVIRSAVLAPLSRAHKEDGTATDTETWKVSIGTGGAITALSDAENEYEEM